MKRILVSLQIIFCPGLIFAADPTLRADLQKIGPLACKFAESYEYWKKGIFDAQIAVAVYEIKSKVEDAGINEIIRDQLKVEKHRGYFKGDCGKNKLFVVSTPSPVQYGDERLKKIITDSCQRFSIDQVGLHGASSQTDLKSMVQKDDVSTALTCDLENSKQEWFLLPPSNWKKVMSFSPSSKKTHKTLIEKSAKDTIYRFINEKRKSEKITLLVLTDGLSQAANNLNASSEILHNRKSMEKELLDLRLGQAHKDVKIILEDRVEALSLDEALNLLWWSPKHRDLILSTKISRIGISATINSEKIKISLLGAG